LYFTGSMPPLKKALSRHFSREASGLFTVVGHGRLLVIGDSSLDVPDNARGNGRVVYYLGNEQGDLSAAAAFTEIADACPIDTKAPVRFMLPDKGDQGSPAPVRNKEVIEGLGFEALGLGREGENGFYELAKGPDPTKLPIYCLTGSRFAYDCIIATIGHSQT
jgi:hypothetical protein